MKHLLSLFLFTFDNFFYTIMDLKDKQRGRCGEIQCSIFSITENTDAYDVKVDY